MAAVGIWPVRSSETRRRNSSSPAMPAGETPLFCNLFETNASMKFACAAWATGLTARCRVVVADGAIASALAERR